MTSIPHCFCISSCQLRLSTRTSHIHTQPWDPKLNSCLPSPPQGTPLPGSLPQEVLFIHPDSHAPNLELIPGNCQCLWILLLPTVPVASSPISSGLPGTLVTMSYQKHPAHSPDSDVLSAMTPVIFLKCKFNIFLHYL